MDKLFQSIRPIIEQRTGKAFRRFDIILYKETDGQAYHFKAKVDSHKYIHAKIWQRFEQHGGEWLLDIYKPDETRDSEVISEWRNTDYKHYTRPCYT